MQTRRTSPPKKMQSVLRGKGPACLHPGVAAAAAAPAAATTARLPRPSPRREEVRRRNPLGASQTCPGENLPFLGRESSATPWIRTFPQSFGIPLLGRSKKYALVP